VKVSKSTGTGYTPLSYIQVLPGQPPNDDPSQRVPYPSESPSEPTGVPKPVPIGALSPRLTFPLSPEHASFSSPDLSHLAHLHKLPPPPPLNHDFFPHDSIPPPLDPGSLPSPTSLPSPLSASAPHLHAPLSPHLISPRGLSNSVPSLPALPPNLVPPTTIVSQSKSNSFNNAVLPPAPAEHAAPAPHLLPKIQRAFSYSAPPPRLVAPVMPSPLQSSDSSDSKKEREREDDDETTETSDYNSDNESSELHVTVPPPAPALPPTLVHELISPQKDAESDALNAKKRKERAEETLYTERTYVKQLTIVYECFVEPLKRKVREKHAVLSDTELFAIFSNIEVILNCHKKLLETFEKRMLVWDSTPELGDIFLENTAFIKLYKYYVNNFDKSIITLKSCREKNSEFQKFAQELDYTERLSGLSIESFLILPVQRIPRYVLLLQDLLKYTSPSHVDFNNLSNALAFIKDLADFINSNKSDADNINKILSIQEALLDLPDDFSLVVPRRRYIDEGGLLYKKQKAYVYLFSDALVFTKIEKKGRRFKALIHLPTASLNVHEEPGILRIISTEGTFRFGAETPKDREHWTKAIRETMDSSRVEMLNSAFTDGNQTEGSNKQFMKFREEEHAVKKRTLIDKLLESEQEYVNSIQYIRGTFIAPLRKAVDAPMPMVALAEFIDITSNLETLLNCHVIFLQSIKERIAEWDAHPHVHDLFTEKTSFLKLYNYYVSNHHKALETIDACIEKYPLFAIFLRDLEAREKVELKVLLTEPLRRVSSYYLIAQEMFQYIKPKTEEYEQMAKVVARLKEQTEKLNADLHAASSKKGGDKKKTEKKSNSRVSKTDKK
jgi:type II secretory pathway component PulM